MKNQTFSVRTGRTAAELKQAILDNLCYMLGRRPEIATLHEWYAAVAYAIRDRMMEPWVTTLDYFSGPDTRIVGYLSAEYLVGPHLGNALINLGLQNELKEALAALNLDITRRNRGLATEDLEGLLLATSIRFHPMLSLLLAMESGMNLEFPIKKL